MTVKGASPGQGFDVNQPLTASEATAFKEAGNIFCVRYIPRTPALVRGNLTSAEIKVILGADLALMAVQHVAEPGWQPTQALGAQYGVYAGVYASTIGLPKGMNIWLDLEGVATPATAQEVIDYCNAWFTAVEAVGYVPGVYVGWQVVLTPEQLYSALPFKHYWRAYNGPDVATRGYQIVQHTAKTLNGIAYDPNTSQADLLGDTAIWVEA